MSTEIAGPYRGKAANDKSCQWGIRLGLPLASLVAQSVKNLPVMQESWVQSLSWEDPLEEGMATHSVFLYSSLENPPRQRGLGACSPWGCKELDRTEQISTMQDSLRCWSWLCDGQRMGESRPGKNVSTGQFCSGFKCSPYQNCLHLESGYWQGIHIFYFRTTDKRKL